MVCDCTVMRNEMISQHKTMLQYFEMLMTEIQDMKQLISVQQQSAHDTSQQNPFAASLLWSRNDQDQSLPHVETDINNSSASALSMVKTKRQSAADSCAVNNSVTHSINIQDQNIEAGPSRGKILVPKMEQEDASESPSTSAKVQIVNEIESSSQLLVEPISIIESAIANLNEQEDNIDSDQTASSSFLCVQCNCGFAQEQALNLHMFLSHSGPNLHFEEPLRKHQGAYKCTHALCGYQTRFAGNLARHLMTHSGEKPYACDFCSFKSNRKEVTVRHTRCKHTNEKPFKCNSCDYRSADKSNLRKHLKRWHGLDK